MSDPREAEALMRDALPLMARGEWAAAAMVLEEAATLHQTAGRRDEAARCLTGAATLRRAIGETAAARALGKRATAAAPADLPIAVASLALEAQAHVDGRQYAAALASYDAALESAERANLGPSARIALLRGKMAAHIANRDFDAAAADSATACALADGRIRGFLRAEQARLLIDAGQTTAAERVLPSTPEADAQLRAEILVERARLARLAGKPTAALEMALQARSSALEAVAPVPYFAAAVEQSQALDTMGKQLEAYTALTAAWGSLADLLGREVARSWVEPCLMGLRIRWGDTRFARIRAVHDAQRRTVLHDAD